MLGTTPTWQVAGQCAEHSGAELYTTLFPERSDRIVLDSVVDPRDVWRSVWRHWGASTEERFEDFAKWAAQRDPTYGLGATPEAVRATYLAQAAKLDAHPMPGPGRTSTGNVFRAVTRGGLYSDLNFVTLAKLWQSVVLGDSGLAAEFSRTTIAAAVNPTQSQIATLWGVVCDDASWPGSIAEHQREVLADKKNFPITNGMPSNVWPCAFWPTKPVEPPVKITSHGPANVLLTQNLRDPATPLVGALAMRAALGQRARIVTADQGGHGAYLSTQNACVSNTATTFLVRGVLLSGDVYCGAGSAKADSVGLTGDQRDRLVQDMRARQFPF